jgi:hypothetical protein
MEPISGPSDQNPAVHRASMMRETEDRPKSRPSSQMTCPEESEAAGAKREFDGKQIRAIAAMLPSEW